MDTGGAKGMPRPLSRPGFHRACWTHLGVAGYFCVNEYGMTELCSQRYESLLADRLAGRSLDTRRLVAPPWLRSRILDPDTLAPVPPGTTGLLCHHDLANLGSVSVVLALFRFELSRLGKWFRRRPRNRSDPAPTVRRALLYMPIAWYPAST